MKPQFSDRRLKLAAFSLLLSEFVRCLGYNLYTVSLPYLAKDLSQDSAYSAILTGIAIGIFGLVQAATQIPLGRLSDRLGRRGILVISALIYAFGALMVGLSQDIYQFIFFRAVQASGAVISVIQACLGDIFPRERRGTAMAWFSMIYAVGTIVGIPLGGFIVAGSGNNLRLPFYLGSTMAFIAAVVLIAFLRETLPSKCVTTGISMATRVGTPAVTGSLSDSYDGARGNPSGISTSGSPRFKYYRVKAFIVTCLIAMTTSFSMGSFFAFAPIFLGGLGYSITDVVFLFIPGIAVFFGGSLASGVWSDRQGRRRPIITGLIIAVTWFLIVPFTPNSLLVPVIIAALLGIAIAQTPLSALILDLVPKEIRGNASGFFNTLTVLANAVGAIMTGFVVQLYGQSSMFVLSGGLMGMTLAMGLVSLPRGRPKKNSG